MRWKILLVTVFAIIIAAFTLMNGKPVNLTLWVTTVRVSLVFVILISVLLGMILMAILWSIQAWKLRRRNSELVKYVRSLEQQLAERSANHGQDLPVEEETAGKDEHVQEEAIDPDLVQPALNDPSDDTDHVK